MDDADDAYDAIPQPDAKRRMLEPSIAELLLYHLRHGHIHPSVVMQCVAEVQSEKGESSDMEPSLGENSLSAPSRVTMSHDQEILLSSPGQEVVTHSDGNLMEEIIHHPVPIYPRYQRISICSNLTNIEVSMNTPQSPKHGLSWSNESLELPIMPAQIVTTIQCETNTASPELDPSGDNLSSELSDLDSDDFESDEEEEEEEEEEEDSVVGAQYSRDVATLEAPQNLASNSVEESRDVPTTHIRSPPVEPSEPVLADPVTIDMFADGGALDSAAPVGSPSASNITGSLELQAPEEPVDLLSELIQQTTADYGLREKVGSSESNQILLDPDAIPPEGVPEMHATVAPSVEIPVCPPTPPLPDEFMPHDGDTEADVATKQTY